MLKAVIFVVATFSAQIFSAYFTQWLNIILIPSGLPITAFTMFFNSIEFFFLLLTLCFIGIWVNDLKQSSLMHTNLKFVCYLICFHISTSTILQIVLTIDKYTYVISPPVKYIINVIHGCARMHFTLDPPAAAIERGLATLNVAHYEKITSRKQWVALMFVKEIIGIITFYALSCTAVGAAFFGIFWIFLLMSTVIIGIILYRVNLRSYKTRIGTLHLTTRYQTVENIRCLKPVLLYSFLAVTQNIIAFILLIVLFIYFIVGNIDAAIIIDCVINLTVSIFTVLYPLSFLLYSLRIRKLIKKKFKFYQHSRVSSSTNTVPVLSVMGKVLTSKNDQNIYFNQLQTAWK